MRLKCYATYKPRHTRIYDDYLFDYEWCDDGGIKLYLSNYCVMILMGKPYFAQLKIKKHKVHEVQFVYKLVPSKAERQFCRRVKAISTTIRNWYRSLRYRY